MKRVKVFLTAKSGKAVAFVFLSVLALCLFVLVIDLSIKGSVSKLIDDETKINGDTTCDAVVVLGAGLKIDGTPSDMLADRLTVGVELYKKGVGKKILLSGDRSDGHDEVGAMKKYITELGVPEEDILIDEKGYSTYESITRLEEFGIRKAVIVTQKYHLYRALYTARQKGIDVSGVPSDMRQYKKELHRNTRETFARIKDAILCMKED